MRPIELSPRLLALARQVPRGARFADVGTDHARLPVWLLEQGIIDSAIATDLRPGPLEAARRTAARHDLLSRLSLRQGDGLRTVKPGEADVVAIAGMGGETIAAILAAAPWTRENGCKVLLQPMTSVPDLRLWLSQNGYVIEREELVQEDKLYLVMTVGGGDMPPLTPAELWAGRQWKGMESPWRNDYLARLQRRVSSALEGLRRSGREESALADWEKLAQQLDAMKKEWEQWQQ